jgi:hypothetical protein
MSQEANGIFYNDIASKYISKHTYLMTQVVMSFFGDQLANGAETEILGIGKHLTYKDFSEDRLLNDINEVLSNKDFQTRVTEVGTVLLDQIDK